MLVDLRKLFRDLDRIEAQVRAARLAGEALLVPGGILRVLMDGEMNMSESEDREDEEGGEEEGGRRGGWWWEGRAVGGNVSSAKP